MIWIRAALHSAVIRRAVILLLALGLTLSPILGASHGWSAIAGVGNSVHHHSMETDHATGHGKPMAAEKDPGCCYLSVFCGTLDLVVEVPEIGGPFAALPAQTEAVVHRLDGIGLTADPPPPRI